MVAEHRISRLREGVDLSIMVEVEGAKERSRRESASSITRCVTRLKMFGSDSEILANRWGVQIRRSMPEGAKSRLRITFPV